MNAYTKGNNTINNLVGSSYLVEIKELIKDFSSIVLIVNNNQQLDNLYSEIKYFIDNMTICKFPDYGVLDYDNATIDNEILSNRFETFINLFENSKNQQIIITTYKAIFNKIPSKENIMRSWKSISYHSTYQDIDNIIKNYKFHKVKQIEDIGQYRKSGEIIDIYSPVNKHPIRINFNGNSIESMKSFSLNTQLSHSEIKNFKLSSNDLYFISSTNIDKYKKYVQENFPIEYIQDLEYENYTKNNNFKNIQNLIPALFDESQSILNLIKNNFICLHQFKIEDEYEQYLERLSNQFNELKLIKYIINPNEMIIDIKDIRNLVETNYFYQFTNDIGIKSSNVSKYSPLPVVSINYKYKNPYINIDKLLNSSNYKIIFYIKREDNYRLLVNYLKENNHLNRENGINIIRYDISEGFIDNRNKVIHISSNDIFGIIKTRINRTKTLESELINSIADLRIDDYVVHEEHGIGKYKGLVSMNVEKKTVELIKIEYAESNNLYTPITSLSLIQKYIGSTGINIKLSSLGTDKWLKIKQRAKKKIEDMAVALLKIQAQRSIKNGYIFKINHDKYNKFCKSFNYVETSDQLNCIDDVINDMCSNKIMDRVICGDVGFGKTEVILRAAYLSLINNKQVIIIVPTTVLANQHFDTFKKRFINYDYKIALLTRTIKTKEKLNILDLIKSGEINIIIGTHTLLSSHIEYHDTGLFIIDEEHKFGVKHKEIIKNRVQTIDVLSLSATPIPRTLNSTLSQIKDMSIISTPPNGRKNILTEVITFDERDIQKYLDREINRGGQILYVHNNIGTMDTQVGFIKNICHSYTVEKIHGKLKSKEIERIMNKFLNNEINILVCTSIIESGLDMSNVNTIIINEAYNFGLSQLHQIRGRVGRSNRQAYAALVIDDKRKLTKDAEKRINAFIQTDSLAGGLEIAGHDLEIRGAGELLGEEQSGQIYEIGYAMYTSMLSKAIEQTKSDNESVIDDHIEINSYESTLIPQDYIDDIFLRLKYYTEIANVKDEYELNQVVIKLEDIYGPIPDLLFNLINLTKVRIYARLIHASNIFINKNVTEIVLSKNDTIKHDQLINHYVLTDKVKIVSDSKLKLTNINDDFDNVCKDIITFFKSISL